MTSPWIDPTTYGAIGDGVTDCAYAFHAATLALPPGGGQIRVPPGKFKIGSALSLAYPAGRSSVSIVGAGADVTTLFWPSNGGLSLALSDPHHSFHLRDLTFSAGMGMVGTALQVTQSKALADFAQSDIVRCTFRGDDAAANSSWYAGVNSIAVSNVNYDGCLFYSGEIGVGVQGTSDAAQSIVHNLSRCGFFGVGVGLFYASETQGVAVSQCNFTNGTTGIWVPPGTRNATQLAVSDSQFNVTGTQVLVQSPLAELIFRGNLLYVPADGVGLRIDATGIQAAVAANCFSAMKSGSGRGVVVDAAFVNGAISGNAFSYFVAGVDLAGAPSGWSVGRSNQFLGCATGVANPGSNFIG